MDDDGDMAEMYFTEKKLRMESSFYGDQSLLGFNPPATGMSVSAPVSSVSSPTESRKLEKAFSLCRSRHDSMKGSDNTATEHIKELEMLLEAYFVVIDSTLNKLTPLKEYIDDTEDFINIHQNNVRNQLVQFELLLTTATFVVAIFGVVVAGIFGMNFDTSIFQHTECIPMGPGNYWSGVRFNHLLLSLVLQVQVTDAVQYILPATGPTNLLIVTQRSIQLRNT